MHILITQLTKWQIEQLLKKPNSPVFLRCEMKRYTDKDLINLLRDKERELGRPPYKSELIQRGTICNRFGGWNNALRKAGIDPAAKPKKTIYSNELLIDILQEATKKLGRPPKFYEVQQATTMAFRFGSWNKALVAAGLKPYYLKQKQ
ncbi:homing endonuclease associated repeat-containing protein [Bacillus subtilis]|uniref:homing endonuclease associated repeat-containing protein n=1 Tax=Bacillus subtilis TaxID=1423 RepID=UPI0013D48203|nr:hypothetical protein [Bacillus subtilis]